MSVQAIAWAFAQDLPSSDKFVLVSLANHASGRDAHCYPSQDLIAQETGLSEATVRRALKRLEGTGHLHRQHRQRRDGSRTSDEYWLNIQPVTMNGREQIQPVTVTEPTGHHDGAILEPSGEPSVNVEPKGSTAPMVPSGDLPDFKKVLFTGGLQWLMAYSGRGEASCRASMGKWLQASGDNARIVLDVLREAKTEQPAAVFPWVMKGIKSRVNGAGFDPMKVIREVCDADR